MEKEKDNINTPQEQENIKDYGMAMVEGSRGKFYCLTIIGQIEGHSVLPPHTKTTKYEHLLPLLVSLEEDESVAGLLVILNTMGGDVEAGLAIAEMLAGMRKPVVSLVIGGGHSIGVPLAVCSDYSFITPTATMTLHPVRISGTVIGAPQSFDMLREMQDRISKFIVEHSGINEEKLSSLLMNTDMIANDVGTVLSGKEAVEIGLINEVGGVAQAIDKLFDLKNHNK